MTKVNDTTIEAVKVVELSSMPSSLASHIEEQRERIMRARSTVLSVAKALDAQEAGEIDFVPALEGIGDLLLDAMEQLEEFELSGLLKKARKAGSDAATH